MHVSVHEYAVRIHAQYTNTGMHYIIRLHSAGDFFSKWRAAAKNPALQLDQPAMHVLEAGCHVPMLAASIDAQNHELCDMDGNSTTYALCMLALQN